MACAIEDAGFEIRDQIMWIYGSGFPKSLNIGKAIDKLQGNEREEYNPGGRYNYSFQDGNSQFVSKTATGSGKRMSILPSKGTSDWEGWGTALKPAHEPIVVARTPLSEKSVAENVLKWGTGGINIDDCRIGTGDNLKRIAMGIESIQRKNAEQGYRPSNYLEGTHKIISGGNTGRFPANVIHDGSDEVLKEFDKAGISKSSPDKRTNEIINNTVYSDGWKRVPNDLNDSGSPARFFYCAKASKSERNAGLDGFEEKRASPYGYELGLGNVGEGMFKDRNPLKQKANGIFSKISNTKERNCIRPIYWKWHNRNCSSQE